MRIAFSGWRGRDRGDVARLAGRVFGSVVFRWLCFGLMTWLALHGEARPAPRVPDFLIDRTPYLAWVEGWNYVLWIAVYVPLGLFLLGAAPRRFVRFMVVGGILSVVRGVTILATGLGPVRVADLNPARLAEPGAFGHAFLDILDPTGVFFRGSAHLYLTKDLFFSGHTATTFLVFLYLLPFRRARWFALALHLVVVASLFFGHIHYTIDVIGAWAITFALFVLAEGWPPRTDYSRM